MAASHYIIRGGIEGRERLRVLARVMRPSTLDFFERAGIRPDSVCLDAGCGGGDVSLELARFVGPQGKVLGVDFDDTKIQLARAEAKALGAPNLEFRSVDLCKEDLQSEFDAVYCRFLLTHLPDPLLALRNIRRALRPGGVLLLADIDFRGYFCEPDCPALWRYVDLYTTTVKRRGGDANIGPRLPGLMIEAGFERVQVNVTQPAALEGEAKLLPAITMENVADAVLAENLASADEIQQIVDDLYEYARTPGTLCGFPRIVEAWGWRDSAASNAK